MLLKEIKRLLQSFKYAWQGISYVYSSQKNMQIHLVVAFIVLLAALVLPIPKTHLLMLFCAIVLVLCLEMINTAIERVVDLVTSDFHPLAKIAKDVAAGGVLLAAVFALIIGIYVFTEPILALLALDWHLPIDMLVIVVITGILLSFIFRKRGERMTKEDLVKEAIKARMKAYAPYSRFPVGAALLLASGQVVRGCNIENASYGLSNCAERTAIFKALSQAMNEAEKTFVALAIVADSKSPIPPCGACRQVLHEFCSPTTPVYLANLGGDIIETTVGELLPGAFSASELPKG